MIAAVLLTACAGAVSTGCTPGGPVDSTPSAVAPPAAEEGSASPTRPPLPATPTDVVTGLAAPWSIAFAGGSALVSERDSARILEITADGEVRELGAVAGVRHGGEGGLLGIATAPGDSALFVYSTADEGNRVQRFALLGEAGELSLGDPDTVIDGIPRSSTHNGGRIAFGPDGMLYVTTGDAGDPTAAQDPTSLAGKILRVTADGGVPEDNPFDGSPVYSLGHRNVQGIAWTDEGEMFASEFGQNRLDELNVIVAGGNYGWPEVEGSGGGDRFVDPVQEWPTDRASPSGIAIIGDTLYLANLRGRVLRAVPTAQPDEATDYFEGEFGRLRAVTRAPDGALWILTGNTDGRGDPGDGDDRILAVDPAAVPG
jgi:glucose/arabinose dehydrogenase